MVWYASVKNGLQYGGGSWDASTSPSTQEAYINGMSRFQNELWSSKIVNDSVVIKLIADILPLQEKLLKEIAFYAIWSSIMLLEVPSITSSNCHYNTFK